MRSALALVLALGIGLPAAARGQTRTENLDDYRLDFSVPDLPAMSAIGAEPDKVSRPQTPRELATALANGFSRDGAFKSGVAIEAAPAMLLGSRNEYARALRFSLATTGTTKGGVTTSQLGGGARWSLGTYDPATDPRLIDCIQKALPKPRPIAAPPPPPAAPAVTPAPGEPAPPPPPPPPVAVGTLPGAGVGQEVLFGILEGCRERFRAAHLADSAIEAAFVLSSSTDKDPNLKNLKDPTWSAWVTMSLGLVSYDEAKAENKAPLPEHPVGFGPTLLFRFERGKGLVGTPAKTDVSAGLRLPVVWDSFGLFAEGSASITNLGEAGGMKRDEEYTIGGGFDLRLSNGIWLGALLTHSLGGDTPSGASLLSNLRWSYGETRPFPR